MKSHSEISGVCEFGEYPSECIYFALFCSKIPYDIEYKVHKQCWGLENILNILCIISSFVLTSYFKEVVNSPLCYRLKTEAKDLIDVGPRKV